MKWFKKIFTSKKHNEMKVYNSLEEFFNTTNIPCLTFKELSELVENNKIKDKNDAKIAEMILDAENDWPFVIHSLNDFLTILEKEIDGSTTKSNIEKLAKRYSKQIAKYAWEFEGLIPLLEIFKLTKEKNLRTIFCKLSEKIKEHN